MISSFKDARLKKARIQDRLRKSRPPGHEQSHGWPLLIAIILWLLVVLILFLSDHLQQPPLAEGQRSPTTVIAEVDFEAVDQSATDLMRRQEVDAVLPVFAINRTALQSALRNLDLFFNKLIEIRDLTPPQRQEALATLPTGGMALPLEESLRLVTAGKEEGLRGALRDSLSSVWAGGIVSVSERDSRFHGVAAAGNISVAPGEAPLRTPVAIDQLRTPEQAAERIVDLVLRQLNDADVQPDILTRLARELIQPNLSYDAVRTDAARQHAQAQVQPVMKQVRAGATLINQGDRVNAQQLIDWLAHERRLDELQSTWDRRLQWIGQSLLILLALVICSGLLHIVRPDLVLWPSRILLLAILSLLSVLSVAGMLYGADKISWMRTPLLESMLLLAFSPILATLLVGPAIAVVVGVWTSFTAAVMFDNSFSVFAMGLLVTIIIAHIAQGVRLRSRMIRIGLWVGLANVIYGLSWAVLTQLPGNLILLQALTGLASGLVAAILALILLPAFEALFDVTTDITLLELSDMGHPLLQRLAIEAPGTYHHSLMVANLAQSAAAEIGANGLLVRVCAYFHDIGKLTKPEFFVENTQFRENPHDDLTPSMSTLVIISHVKEGVGMARRAKLPPPIIEAIEQHHGSGLVAYFYHRAKTQKDEQITATGSPPTREISEADYRYPGPKPQNAEMGILLLADSVEAASRSMEKPTPSRIEQLVHAIVDSRLHDGQLDECDLTFHHLKAIKRSFIFTLTNMLHGRVPYPTDEPRHKQSTEALPTGANGADRVHAVGHGTSAST